MKSRTWVFTINNYHQVPESLPSGVRYLCYGKEVGLTGTKHLQGLAVFRHARYRPDSLFQQFGQGWFEVARGSIEQNVRYCKKGGDFTELGERPLDPRRKGEKEIERWEQALLSAQGGKLDDIPADILIRHYNTFLKIASRHQQKPAELDQLDNLWLVGPSGCGKSTWVHRSYPGAFIKGWSKWWDGFDTDDIEHKTVVLDDLHPKWAEKELLKNWADKFPFVAEVKGGAAIIRPERIIVTSNYTPEQVIFSRSSWSSSIGPQIQGGLFN